MGKAKTISQQVQETLDQAITKSKIVRILEISFPTLQARMENDSWTDREVILLKKYRIIKHVGRNTNR